LSVKLTSPTEAYTANITRRNGAKMEITFTVFAPTFSAEFPVAVLAGPDRVLVGRPVELGLELVAVPFNLCAFLAAAARFSSLDSSPLMTPTPPELHPQRSKNHMVLFRSVSSISTLSIVWAVPLTASRRPESKPLKVAFVS
jgi:hypothetical protein